MEMSKFLLNHPYLSMTQNQFFRFLSSGFPIGMKKLKIYFFQKNVKKNLGCEFQKTRNFDLTCGTVISFFFYSKIRVKFLLPLWIKLFEVSEFHGKSWFFRIKLPILQKRWVKKRLFSKSPICNPKVIFVIFQKNQLFWKILCSNLHFY